LLPAISVAAQAARLIPGYQQVATGSGLPNPTAEAISRSRTAKISPLAEFRYSGFKKSAAVLEPQAKAWSEGDHVVAALQHVSV